MAIHETFIYLRVRDANAAIEFYERAFEAKELFRLVEPSGRVGHAELEIGDATVMLSDEYPELGLLGPTEGVRPPAMIHLHVDDADAAIAHSLECGATLVRPASDAFYGERSGTVRDPFGHEWMLGHSLEEVTPEEMQRRYTALFD